MWKWILIIFVGFLVFRVVDKIDFGTSDKPANVTVISDGKTIRSSTKPLVPSTGKPDTPDTLQPAVVAGASVPDQPAAVPTPVVIQPSQEQLQEATRPLAIAATAAVEAELPPMVVPAAPPPNGSWRLVEAKLDEAGNLKYGVIAMRPDGSYGLIWSLQGRPLNETQQQINANYIITGLVRGDDVPPGM